jgi:hypothetical protein
MKKIIHTGKYHIYQMSKNKLQMNDANINTHNPIFRVLYRMNTRPTTYTQYKLNQLHNSEQLHTAEKIKPTQQQDAINTITAVTEQQNMTCNIYLINTTLT